MIPSVRPSIFAGTDPLFLLSDNLVNLPSVAVVDNASWAGEEISYVNNAV